VLLEFVHDLPNVSDALDSVQQRLHFMLKDRSAKRDDAVMSLHLDRVWMRDTAAESRPYTFH
jgi:hypothetical protein